MYTIVMDKYKNLNTTVRTVLFQKESLVDKIQFLIPPIYEDEELVNYNAVLKYVDPNGNFHSEILACDGEMYKNYLRYTLPITSELTNVAGEIVLRITFIDFSEDTENPEIYRLETNSTTLRINKPDKFNDWVNGEDLEAYKAQIAKLNAEMPTDLEIGEGENLHLVHDDTQIGKGVEILQHAEFDELDDENDGIVDVDNLKPDPQPTPNQFIEL
jgi:hypothetical protein